ncbi:hypothetical protein BVX97_03005 [bacterium E08(2017)]|nr:hypothetical protein BVX97_03005 [bacterium E08(2017)]
MREKYGIRVLLVEDDQESGQALKAAIELNDIDVTWMLSAEEVMDNMELAKYDAIVSDIRLGGASGVDLLSMVRKESRDFPVILLTAYSDIEAAIEAVKLGANDYMMKPLDDIETLMIPLLRAIDHYRTLLHNHELQKKNREYMDKLMHLGSQLVLAEEQERRKLALDLHDSIGQLLGAAIMQLDLVSRSEDWKKHVENAHSQVGEAVERTRALALELSSPVLYHCGLMQAVQELCGHMGSSYDIDIIFSSDNSKVELPEDSSILLYRSVRELLMNVIKHADASQATVNISFEPEQQYKITVEDDGKGFEVRPKEEWVHMQSLGLFSIMDRCNALGGVFQLESKVGEGTVASVSVPLLSGPNN